MSALSQQLRQIKNSQRSLKVGPSQQQPTLIFDQNTATTTSHDLIYTLAIISYSKILTAQPSLRQQGQIVMAENNRQINRNTLTKEANRQLSENLIKFLLKLSPFLLTADCQKIIEYLLHNYKINTFQAEALAIIYLQYWNTPIYVTLISNIPQKILANKLSFLQKLKTEPVNISFIVKHLLYSHYLTSSLILYTLEYMKTESTDNITMDIEINLGEEVVDTEPAQNLIRCDPRRFLLQVFSELINRQFTSSYKYVIEFCAKAVQLKHQSAQTVSMVMLLSTRLFLVDSISDQLLTNLQLKLLKKLSLFNQKTTTSLFDFTLIIWQRRPSCIKKEILYYLQDQPQFINYISKFKCSLSMILIRLVQLYLQGSECHQLISCIGARLKRDQFYEMYSEQYHNKLFELFERAFSLQNGDHINFIGTFIKQNFIYQAATHYHAKTIPNTQFKEFLLALFPKKSYQLTGNGTVLFNTAVIKRKIPTVAKPKKEQAQVVRNQSQQSDAENQPQKKQKHSLLQRLRKLGFEVNQIDYSNSQIKEALIKILSKCYDGGHALSLKQKTAILQNYPEQYNQKYLQIDLKQGNFILPIKYLTTHNDLNAAKICTSSLVGNISLIDNVLFRELLRLSLEQITLTLNTQYKSIIYFVNTLFKQLLNKYLTQQGENVQLLKLSQVLLKISEALFVKGGIKRGRYHRILHNHGKVVAELLMRVKQTKKISTNYTKQQAAILEHYVRIVNIFKPQNLYLLNIGIIQTLTRKQLDHSQLRYFITSIIFGSLNQSGVSHQALAVSIIKTLVFCSQLATIRIPSESIHPSFSSGIAKSVISDYFGLVKEKFKRVITKKLLLYIRSVFQDTYVVEHFKSHLIQLPKNQLPNLLEVYTELYRILGVLESEDKQIYNFRQIIMDKITNIFPFDLRLALFEPLLPDQHLYKYLGEQLAEHRPQRSQFEQLASLVNIVPTSVSSEWVHFVRECLKRAYYPAQQSVTAILQNKQLGDISNYAQYVCALAEYCPSALHAHLDKSVQIIQSHCAEPNDFTLAIISKMIRSLGELLQPYLQQLLQVSLAINSEHIPQFIEDITEHLVTPTLIKVIRSQAKHAKNIHNFCLFFKSAASKGVGDSLNKTLLSLMSRALTQLAEVEESPQDIAKLQAQIFFQIGIKMNESQLRKMIIDLVRWSETKTEIQQSLPFNLRKISVAHIFSILSQNLQTLFNPFFGYVFQSFLKDYQAITSAILQSKQKAKVSSEKKRSREVTKQYHSDLTQSYLKVSLHCFKLLFTNDTNHQFLDSFKIQALADPLTQLVLLYQLDNFTNVLDEHLAPCLIAFHQAIADDYQMKTVNLKIMVLLKNKNSKIHRAVFELTDQLIEALNDRFLLLVNDLIPFLLQYAGSRNQGISKIVRKIISRIEQLSGEQIQNYVK